MQADWELSQQFVSDSQGIRCAIALPNSVNDVDSGWLLTGSQGGGLYGFGIPSGDLLPVEYQHNHSVTAIAYISTLNLYATGCKDAQIRLFDAKTNECVATLGGHEKPVTSLAVLDLAGEAYLLSGSWDGTAKVWNVARRAMLATLPDHENSVCVTGLSTSVGDLLKVATGSAGIAQGGQIVGHTLRLWTVNVKTSQVQCTHQVANDHDGPIRDIAQVGNVLVTSSNDGTVRCRSIDTGDSLSTLYFLQQQHPPMLLSVTSMDVGTSVAAGAEDGHVIIWNLDAMEDPQVILHPACVWNVMSLANGDLVTCCDDGVLRIFTRSSDRMAPVAERDAFAQAVQEAHARKSTGPSPEEVAKLPRWEQNLSRPGNSEGQVHIFNKGGIAIAAQWSVASQTWIEVGQVTGSNDGGMVDGEAFDHVLPIEVDQTGGGVAKLQIGYNNGENPFVAAQRFLDNHVLGQHYLHEIARYIEQRVGKEAPTLGGSGTAATAAVATAGVPMISYQHLPMPGYITFDLPAKTAITTLEKMKAKIQEFGKLSQEQLVNLSSLMETLGATSRYHASTISPAELALISDMLDTFSPAEVFPALDLARLTVTHPDAAASKNEACWTKILAQAVGLTGKTNGLEGPAALAIPMLSLRLFANSFKGGPGSCSVAAAHLEDMLQCATLFLPSGNKNVRLSVATLLYNMACFLHTTKATRPEIAAQIVTLVDKILQARTYEAEGIVRSLVALGTVVLSNPEVKEVAKGLYVVSRVEMAASPHGDLARAVAREVYHALQ
jgi:phospholipase A-2-activating protein